MGLSWQGSCFQNRGLRFESNNVQQFTINFREKVERDITSGTCKMYENNKQMEVDETHSDETSRTRRTSKT